MMNLSVWGWYGLVFLMGISVGIAEVISTFTGSPKEALKTKWAWALVLLNGLASALVLLIVTQYTQALNLLTVLAVGVGFPTLIRTKFIVAKQFTGTTEGNDLSLNFGWLYEQFQSLCKTQIDLGLMKFRQQLAEQLLTRLPTLTALTQVALHTILTRAALSEQERQSKQKYVQDSIPTLPEDVGRLALALFILDTGGREYVQSLIAGRPAAVSEQELVRNLAGRFDLASLVSLAEQAVQSGPQDERDRKLAWVHNIRDSATLPDERKLIALARFMLKTAGREYIESLP